MVPQESHTKRGRWSPGGTRSATRLPQWLQKFIFVAAVQLVARGGGAQGENRTRMTLRTADFESAVSTSSTTRAWAGSIEGRPGTVGKFATFRTRAASKPLVSRLTEIAVSDDIVQKARCGEGSAQAHIYEVLSPAVHGLIRRIVGNRALAEDLFQDTMMTVFERIGSFRGEAPLGAWVRQVAVTRCLMYLPFSLAPGAPGARANRRHARWRRRLRRCPPA